MARVATGRRAAKTEAYRKQRARFDAIRLKRPLTAKEQAEADRLVDREYHRLWRAGLTSQPSRTARS